MKNILNLLLIFTISLSTIAQNTTELNVEDKVPTFSGLDDTGNEWNSSDVLSDFLVVYFYPAAMTGGCTAQACAYRDDKVTFDKMGVTIIGVSGDEVANLKHFKESSQLNFPLLSDPIGNIAKIFGVPTKDGGSITREFNGDSFMLTRGVTAARWTFVLDKDRKIIYKNAEVTAAEDSKKVQAIIKNYTK
ncbi:peroxiredoxin [uncultured Lutibacter sp.]|uniref:peroxiredoxin n=1 Tax=uncultured Lutibacter sp. TaxID=437739 RepID=UPI002604E798|nr:peroxiredoxin [uncultured Lutibacter sp.]